jgi:tellurite resistance protein TehA-like permease
LKAISTKGFQPRAHLAILALVSFILSFIAARSFTYFYPDVVLVSGGFHIHHFWFGMVLLAVGGWLGISYNQKEIDRLAAIIYGVGGGLIADEVGLLLTFGNYYSGLTWTFMIVLLSFVSTLILFNRYRQNIREELHEFVSSRASLYFGVFMAAVSVAFILETDNLLVTAVSAGLTVTAFLIVLAFLIHQIRQPSPKKLPQ